MDKEKGERGKSLNEIEREIEKKYEEMICSKDNLEHFKEVVNIKKEDNTPTEKEIVFKELKKEKIPEKKPKIKRKIFKGKNILSDYVEDIKEKLDKPDYRGQKVFLEESGEKLGTISDMIYDKNNNLTGFKIKDEYSNSFFEFPTEQFNNAKKGLLYLPKWYVNADKNIKNYEFLDRTHPEYKEILSTTGFDEELLNIFFDRDEEYNKFLNDAKKTHRILTNQIKIFEKKKNELKERVWDLTTTRLIEELDRKRYAEEISKIKRKANVYNLNIEKYKKLISRLENTSFGWISKNKLERKNEDIDENLDQIFAKLLDKKINAEIKKSLIKSLDFE